MCCTSLAFAQAPQQVLVDSIHGFALVSLKSRVLADQFESQAGELYSSDELVDLSAVTSTLIRDASGNYIALHVTSLPVI